jgi:hypothetical protein
MDLLAFPIAGRLSFRAYGGDVVGLEVADVNRSLW